jgi:hypothetical protein
MKHINHIGSASLLVLALLLLVLALLPMFGLEIHWKPNTTPHRLATDSFTTWSLFSVLGLGLLMIRVGSPLQQCISALVFFGVVSGLAITSALYWDPWLPAVLVFAALPVLRSASGTLATLSRQMAVEAHGLRRNT